MDVSIGDDDSFGVVREIVQVIELLYFVGLVFEIKQVAVCLLNGENGDFFN